MNPTTDVLFQSYQLNDGLTLKNRIVMAPMTRNMAHNDLSPTKAMAEYYRRRVGAGLIITEGTIIRPDARGYSNVPGIFTQKQFDLVAIGRPFIANPDLINRLQVNETIHSYNESMLSTLY